MSRWPPRQALAIHVQGAAGHRRSSQHIFAGCLFDKANGSDNLHIITCGLLHGHKTKDATEVIDMTVREQDRGDRFVTKMFACKGDRLSRCRLSGQRVDNNPPAIALDDGDVRQVKTPQLVNAISNFVQAPLHVEL